MWELIFKPKMVSSTTTRARQNLHMKPYMMPCFQYLKFETKQIHIEVEFVSDRKVNKLFWMVALLLFFISNMCCKLHEIYASKNQLALQSHKIDTNLESRSDLKLQFFSAPFFSHISLFIKNYTAFFSVWNFVCVTDFRDIVQTTMIKEDISKNSPCVFQQTI